MTLLLIVLLTFLAVRTAATGLHLWRTERQQLACPVPLDQEGDDPALGGSPRQKRCLEGAPGSSEGLEGGVPLQEQQQQQDPSGKARRASPASALGWSISTAPAWAAGERDKDVDAGEAQHLKQLQDQPQQQQQELGSSGSWLRSSSSRMLLDGILDPGSPDRRSAPLCRRGDGVDTAPAEQFPPASNSRGVFEVDRAPQKAAIASTSTAPQVRPADSSCCRCFKACSGAVASYALCPPHPPPPTPHPPPHPTAAICIPNGKAPADGAPVGCVCRPATGEGAIRAV